MQIDEKWYELYEKIYGKEFNRVLTIGNSEIGYSNNHIKNLDEISDYVEKGFPKEEFYISLYNYNTTESVLRWNSDELFKYEKHAKKNCILFRFKQNTDIIKEEINSMDDIQKFMFIRRSINLGFNKSIVTECKKTYNFFKTHFGIKGILIFNGYDECLLLYNTAELKLKNAGLTYTRFFQLFKEKLELQTLINHKIEPFSQVMPLPGTQNKNSRLYIQLYYPDLSYEEIMLNSQEKFLDESHLEYNEDSTKLEEFIKNLDNKIDESNNKISLNKIWNQL